MKIFPSKKRLYIIIFTIAALTTGMGSALFFILWHNLPAIESLQNFSPSGVTSVLDHKGRLLAEVSHERRKPVSLSNVPDLLVDTLVEVEDSQFYQHPGISVRGIARAFLKNLLKGRVAQGGSTLTQQLTKVLFLTPEKSIIRKLKEALIAFQIEKHYTKDEILEIYLNQIYFGEGNYGIASATNYYYCKPLEDLNPAEIATLAGLPKGPNIFAPTKNRTRSKKRRDSILRLMVKSGLLPQDQLVGWIETPIEVTPCKPKAITNHVTAKVVRQAVREVGESQVFRSALRIKTTLDGDLQKLAEKAVLEGLLNFKKRHPKIAGRPDQAVYNGPEAALVAIDATSGGIRALVGGSNFGRSQFDRVYQAIRQAGSTFKPLLFALAIERDYTQASILQDTPLSYPDGKGGKYQPKNYTNDFLGPMTLRLALETSRNTVAVQLASRFGMRSVAEMAKRLGIQAPIPGNLTAAIGSASLTLLELTRAYTPFVTSGILSDTHTILHIRDKSGEPLHFAENKTRQVLSEEVAYIMQDMLRGVLIGSAGESVSKMSCHVGGKTGTTNSYTDALFIGFINNLVVGVRVGYDDNRPLGYKESGSRAAMPIWLNFARQACALIKTAEPFHVSQPTKIVRVSMDRQTGLLSSPVCQLYSADAAFIRGTEPKKLCR